MTKNKKEFSVGDTVKSKETKNVGVIQSKTKTGLFVFVHDSGAEVLTEEQMKHVDKSKVSKSLINQEFVRL
jgi:hypothetical protein